MDSGEHSKVIAFDTLFSTNHIQMLKILLPCLENQLQKKLAIYIKFLELQYTLDFYKKNPYPLCGCMKKESAPDIGKLCSELLPFCTEKEKKQMEQIRSFLQNMEMYKEMAQTMDMMKDILPNMPTNSDENNIGKDFDIMETLLNLLTPEQQQMYELFGGNHHAE